MSDSKEFTAKLTIDFNRGRFRLHKATLARMGSPAFVQFLVNTEEMYIALLGTDKPIVGGTANRVHNSFNVRTQRNVEFSSVELLRLIARVIGNLDTRFSYQLTGEVDPQNQVAYYSFKTLQKIERDLREDGKRVLYIKH